MKVLESPASPARQASQASQASQALAIRNTHTPRFGSPKRVFLAPVKGFKKRYHQLDARFLKHQNSKKKPFWSFFHALGLQKECS